MQLDHFCVLLQGIHAFQSKIDTLVHLNLLHTN